MCQTSEYIQASQSSKPFSSFGEYIAPMIASGTYTSGQNISLEYKNICGIIHLQLTGATDLKVNQIVIKPIATNVYLSGLATVGISLGQPAITMATSANKYVTLDCVKPIAEGGDGIALSSTPTDFYIVVPPFSGGFTVEIGTNKGIWTKNSNTSISIARNTIKTMQAMEISEASLLKYDGGSYGVPVNVAGVWVAPVNCGYDPTTYTYGKLYQFGNPNGLGYNDNSEFKTETAPSLNNTAATSIPFNSPVANNFYANWGKLNTTANFWSDTPGSRNPKDPCPDGWRVPSKEEMQILVITILSHDLVSDSDGRKGAWFGVEIGNYNNSICLLAGGGLIYPSSTAGAMRNYGCMYWTSSFSAKVLSGNYYGYSLCAFDQSASHDDVLEYPLYSALSLRCIKK